MEEERRTLALSYLICSLFEAESLVKKYETKPFFDVKFQLIQSTPYLFTKDMADLNAQIFSAKDAPTSIATYMTKARAPP